MDRLSPQLQGYLANIQPRVLCRERPLDSVFTVNQLQAEQTWQTKLKLMLFHGGSSTDAWFTMTAAQVMCSRLNCGRSHPRCCHYLHMPSRFELLQHMHQLGTPRHRVAAGAPSSSSELRVALAQLTCWLCIVCRGTVLSVLCCRWVRRC